MVTVPLEDEFKLLKEGTEPPKQKWDYLQKKFPRVWAETNPPGLAKHHAPVVVQLLASATPTHVWQYPLRLDAKVGISKHIHQLQEAGILVPCQSAWNTPLLPVRKPGTSDFRPVQDLWEVNSRVETVHPMVLNPYTLLSLIPPAHVWYSVLDLKDAFFSLSLAPVCQPLFAFEWTDPDTRTTRQLTWTRLLQGFKNSPTLFGEALSKDLQEV
ncbi:uncharacterized protein LOC106010649 isoform X2 [Heterocephalus glaber]|uniref:RNA-directed DNA polymerase n=1 Tax=Heterocephalus glaber TaxID=10181 RepID=A0AAX6REE4_HETGA|nr:uncharacterized protein LOC106010649 isoform X2 [Heterocephalus glaber]